MRSRIAISTILCCPAMIAQHPADLILNKLNDSEIPDGAGCGYSLKSDHNKPNIQTVFAIPAELDGIGLIKVNGFLHRLTQKELKESDSKAGQTFERWSDGELTLEFWSHITGEGEGGVSSEGKIVLILHGIKKAFEVEGGCGC